MRFLVPLFAASIVLTSLHADDEIHLKNGESAEVKLEAVTENIVTFIIDSPRGPSKRTIQLDTVDFILWGYGVGEESVFSNLESASREVVEKLWNEYFPHLHRPRSRTARYGIVFADRLLETEREQDWKRGLGIFDRIIEKAWSGDDKDSAKQGRLRALIRLGQWEQAKSEAELLTSKTEDPKLLIEVRYLMASADFDRLRKLEEDNPRWLEDDEVYPVRNDLYHSAIDQFLWPFLFYGTREEAAVRGLVAVADVYQFAGEKGRASASLNDAIQLYPATEAAEAAREKLAELSTNEIESSTNDKTDEP